MLLLVMFQAKACNFTKCNTSPSRVFYFFSIVQIAQSITIKNILDLRGPIFCMELYCKKNLYPHVNPLVQFIFFSLTWNIYLVENKNKMKTVLKFPELGPSDLKIALEQKLDSSKNNHERNFCLITLA